MASTSYLSRHTQNCCLPLHRRLFSVKPANSSTASPLGTCNSPKQSHATNLQVEDDAVPTSGISRPLSHILKELNKRVPETLLKLRSDPAAAGSAVKYMPWHTVNRIMNLHAPEWSGEVRSITYSADGKTVSVVFRVTLYGTDAEIFRESTGSATVGEANCGDPVQKAEAMAFCRACARFGLGLHLYHKDMNQ